jgi:hypothetical protein
MMISHMYMCSNGMDLLGSMVLGTITAVGGGTIRDSIVLRKRPFWSDGEFPAAYNCASYFPRFGVFEYVRHARFGFNKGRKNKRMSKLCMNECDLGSLIYGPPRPSQAYFAISRG